MIKRFIDEFLWFLEWCVWDPAVSFLMDHWWAQVLTVVLLSAATFLITMLLLVFLGSAVHTPLVLP